MNEVNFSFYSGLLNDGFIVGKISKQIEVSDKFNQLLGANILAFEKKGRGKILKIKKENAFKKWFENHFPNQHIEVKTKADSIAKYRNSKTANIKSTPTFFIRGFKNVCIQNVNLNLQEYTNNFGLFAFSSGVLKTDKICFVENLECFQNAEKLLGDEYVFIHKYGRIGLESLKMINARNILFFADYDYVGLNEYLKVKEVFDSAELFVPENFNELFLKYSVGKKDKQIMTDRVSQSKIKEVVDIRDLVSEYNKFLEQEILFKDII